MWKCENCETINDGDICVVCGEKKTEKSEVTQPQKTQSEAYHNKAQGQQYSFDAKQSKRNKIIITVCIIIMICSVMGTAGLLYLKYSRHSKQSTYSTNIPAYDNAMQLYYDKNYAEATWAFAELGTYKDSEEMKKRSELSWRKSLANVVTDNYLGGMELELYSISPTGVVKSINGNAHEGLEPNEHGKVVSLGDNEKLYALREDGYVENIAQNIGISNGDWDNVIQISPVLDGTTNVALRSDGKMLYGDVGWVSEMANWDKIIKFETYNNVQAGGAMVIGLTSKGELCGVVDGIMATCLQGDFKSILNNFKNVVEFDFYMTNVFSGMSYDETLIIVATTSDGKILSFANGQFKERVAGDVVGVSYSSYLTADGKIMDLDTNTCIAEDVVYMNKGEFYIKRNGSIHSLYDMEYMNELKTNVVVYDEWVEMLN